ncbi:hypothetical protein [Romboutsia sp. 1001713B170207_170306_H8]|uniref:hypothetical protein n=1 Tax=Romboutsia sp. 1001713B170207_170306_H8 TaxID=2787112 RepID=UPI001899D3E0|nr:hypothetical protein [Romboutsia sp. 1001713B170207_170306_H8]
MFLGWITKGSILFGLIAVVIPIINLMRQDKAVVNNLGIFSGISISACAISLCMQIFYANHLVNIEDWSALMDILSTVANVSVVLLVATIILNVIVYIKHKEKQSQV